MSDINEAFEAATRANYLAMTGKVFVAEPDEGYTIEERPDQTPCTVTHPPILSRVVTGIKEGVHDVYAAAVDVVRDLHMDAQYESVPSFSAEAPGKEAESANTDSGPLTEETVESTKLVAQMNPEAEVPEGAIKTAAEVHLSAEEGVTVTVEVHLEPTLSAVTEVPPVATEAPAEPVVTEPPTEAPAEVTAEPQLPEGAVQGKRQSGRADQMTQAWERANNRRNNKRRG